MFTIIKREVLLLLRDKANIFFIILFPSLLVFLLGSLLTHLDISDWEIEPMKIEYAIATEDPQSVAGIEVFLEAINENDSVELIKVGNLSDIDEKLQQGELAAAVEFTNPFGVYIYKGMDDIQNRAVESMFKGFISQAGAITALSELSPEALQEINSNSFEGIIQEEEFTRNRSMIDYYAVAMLVMILFMGGSINGASGLYESRMEGTLARAISAPKSRVSIYIQTILGGVPQILIQVSVIMICSTLLFGAKYADTAGGNILLFLTFFIAGLSINALFAIIGMFINWNPTFICMPVMWAMMFVSGTFSKEIYIEGVTNRMPIWLLQNAAFDLTVFGHTEKCITVIVICGALLLVSVLAGALLFQRKEVVK